MLVYQRVTFTAEPGRLKSGWILVDCWPHSWGALVHQGWKLSLGTWDCLWDDWDGVSPFFFISNLEETARKERSTRKISRMMSTYIHCPDRVVVTFLCLIHGDIFRLPFWGSTNNPAIQGANWTNQWADESYHWQSKGRLCRAASKLEPFKSAF